MSEVREIVAGSSREEELRHAVVRILDRGFRVVGTGFLVKRDLIATCAHVVREALQEKGQAAQVKGGETVDVQLPVGVPEGVQALPAAVEGNYFRDSNAEDVAFLRVKSPLPDGVKPLALRTSDTLENPDLRGWAFPKVGRDGLWMTATLVGPLETPRTGRRLQLRSTNISPGCSGGPLWDDSGRVVGMAVAIVDQEAKTGRHGDTAKAIAAEVLAGICPELSVHHAEPSPAPRGVPGLAAPLMPASTFWGPSKLSGPEMQELVGALLSAFPSRSALAQMVRVGLDENLDAIAAPGNLRATAFELVGHVEAQGLVPRLFDAALAAAPGNPDLRAIVAKRQG